MKSFVNLFRGRRGEVATILTLISVVLMLAGVSVGSFVAQKETKTQSKAADSVKVRAQDISNYCLGDTGEEGKVATTLCLAWGQGNGKSVGPHYCCDECNESQAGVWTNTCYRPNSQSTNYRGPCNSDAGVAFPLVCTKDPTDNKWKWVSQNHYGECNVSCATDAVSSTPTQAPSNTPTPIENTPTIDPVTADCNIVGRWICTIGAWTNCLGPGTDKQGLFEKTYCAGPDGKGPELMWKYQAAQEHGSSGNACGGIQQKLISEGCNDLPPTNTPTPIPNQPSNTPAPSKTPSPTSSEIPTPTFTPTPRQGGPVPSPTFTPTPTDEQKIYCHSCIGEDNGTCNERILKKSDNQTCQGVYMLEGGCYTFTCPKNTPTPKNEQKIYCHSCIGVDKDICNERVLLVSENQTCQGVYMEDGGCYVSTCSKPLVIDNPSPTPTDTPTSTPTPTVTSTPTPTATPTPKLLCQPLDIRGSTSGKFNLVILSDHFGTYEEFFEYAKKVAPELDKTNLGELRNKINIFVYTDITHDFNTVLTPDRRTVIFNFVLAKQVIAACQGDAFLIIANIPESNGQGGAFPTFGAALVKEVGGWAFGHELCHVIAFCDDEYAYNNAENAPFLRTPQLNCSETSNQNQSPDVPCPKWAKDFPDADCIRKCTYGNWYRPSESNIMTGGSYMFDQPSLELWRRALNKYSL